MSLKDKLSLETHLKLRDNTLDCGFKKNQVTWIWGGGEMLKEWARLLLKYLYTWSNNCCLFKLNNKNNLLKQQLLIAYNYRSLFACMHVCTSSVLQVKVSHTHS